MQPRFRVAKIEDVRGIVELCNEVFEENTDVARAEEIFRSVATDEKHFYVIGEMDGRIVAHANVTIVPTISEGLGTYAVLNHVCVRPDVRRGGIGMKLLNACFAVAKHYDCARLV